MVAVAIGVEWDGRHPQQISTLRNWPESNSFHKLEVRTRDNKLTVQARNGFYVQPGCLRSYIQLRLSLGTLVRER